MVTEEEKNKLRQENISMGKSFVNDLRECSTTKELRQKVDYTLMKISLHGDYDPETGERGAYGHVASCAEEAYGMYMNAKIDKYYFERIAHTNCSTAHQTMAELLNHAGYDAAVIRVGMSQKNDNNYWKGDLEHGSLIYSVGDNKYIYNNFGNSIDEIEADNIIDASQQAIKRFPSDISTGIFTISTKDGMTTAYTENLLERMTGIPIDNNAKDRLRDPIRMVKGEEESPDDNYSTEMTFTLSGKNDNQKSIKEEVVKDNNQKELYTVVDVFNENALTDKSTKEEPLHQINVKFGPKWGEDDIFGKYSSVSGQVKYDTELPLGKDGAKFKGSLKAGYSLINTKNDIPARDKWRSIELSNGEIFTCSIEHNPSVKKDVNYHMIDGKLDLMITGKEHSMLKDMLKTQHFEHVGVMGYQAFSTAEIETEDGYNYSTKAYKPISGGHKCINVHTGLNSKFGTEANYISATGYTGVRGVLGQDRYEQKYHPNIEHLAGAEATAAFGKKIGNEGYIGVNGSAFVTRASSDYYRKNIKEASVGINARAKDLGFGVKTGWEEKNTKLHEWDGIKKESNQFVEGKISYKNVDFVTNVQGVNKKRPDTYVGFRLNF